MKKIALFLVASTLAGCTYGPEDDARRGLAAVKVPVVERTNYAYDVPVSAAGVTPAGEAALDAWMSSLGVGYGDRVYLDGMGASYARDDVARIAGRYGLLLAQGAPVTQGSIEPGTARIVVSRARATVPGCPDWDDTSNPNPGNGTMANYGCAVNANRAAMVANPEDLVFGRAGTGVIDPRTTIRALDSYRAQRPTGETGLQDITTKKEDK
ncbi:CpaD family pilus assembly protein [Sphingomicrobium nitratireducens]|uniref:CpaD family pilus assembly protein n=1 Tax=Sphingomicrobium nitratireducens TaxID=2964666 RepID=UPI00223F46CD|nr:CpaD family pilus assembly lipoprotein [Sphingomicrobium nitratireducens]